MTILSLDSVVKITQEQVSCELSGEVVVLSLKSGEYYGLNAVAAAAWSLMEEPRTVLELRDALLEEFTGVSAAECTAELLTLIEELRELELVSIA
jgi:hypothetical protein